MTVIGVRDDSIAVAGRTAAEEAPGQPRGAAEAHTVRSSSYDGRSVCYVEGVRPADERSSGRAPEGPARFERLLARIRAKEAATAAGG